MWHIIEDILIFYAGFMTATFMFAIFDKPEMDNLLVGERNDIQSRY